MSRWREAGTMIPGEDLPRYPRPMTARRSIVALAGAIVVSTALGGAQIPASASRDWFQKTEQALMDAVAIGDTKLWDAIMDDRARITSEEGDVQTKAEF